MPDTLDLPARVAALAAQSGHAFPGGEDLRPKLLHPAALPAPRRRLAKGLVAWWRESDSPAPELTHLVAEAIAWAWQGQTDAECLESGLLPVYLRVLRQTQQHTRLLSTLERWPRRPEPEDAWQSAAVAGLAHCARTHTALSSLRRIGALLAQWMNAPDAAQWLSRLPATSQQALASAALRTGLLSSVALFCSTEPAPEIDADLTARLLQALTLHLGGATVRPWAQRAVARHPTHPGVRLALLQALAASGASPAELAPLSQGVDMSHASAPAFLSGVATWAFESGQAAVARDCLQALARLGPLPPANAAQWQHLSVAQTGQTPHAETPSLTALAPLAAALSPLADLLKTAPRHDSALSAADLQQQGLAALAHFERHLETPPGLSAAQWVDAASTLWAVANAGALELRHWQGVFPFDFGPDLGSIDPLRASAQCDAVLAHLLSLCRLALRRLDHTEGAQVQEILRLARWQCEAQWAVGQAKQALHDITQLQAQLAPLGDWGFEALRERCALEAGDTAAAQASRQHLPLATLSRVWPAHEWTDWLAAQGAREQHLCADPALPGTWSIASPDGQVRAAHFATLPAQLSSVRLQGLQVRHGHLLLTAAGGLLLPHAWHRQMGAFPFPHPDLLSRGLGAATLREPASPQRVSEPLLVLANLDATFHRNYYHWMVLTLARLHWAASQGLLQGRRALLPAELSGWMLQSLQDAGIPPEAMRLYRQDEALVLDDALVLSPQEWASATQVDALRHTLWRAAGLNPADPPPPQRLLYLTRRGELRRPFAQEQAVADLATRLGFECVAPETLSLLDQVRLFAQARGIAGPPGAAFTNLMWAQAGTKVLTLFKEEINGPTFLDLSFIRGQQHRWLQGRSLPGFEHTSVVTSPYDIDLRLAERELRWVAAAGDSSA
ncbi:glycosyltransferase family 61 protein [Ideonella paludis]|uniref:Glycosyltransferase family 61 protein n=1 Tax=Ideonella paludis TaxID=1233411 RepID=A0ABS5DRH0_9BURK|nr:glycosyltransferase family 61 protein [Ideonella paludis]MBQ0933740.1 glycosyltransferase family 61 protein [Ideonella paludis]